MVVDRCRRDLHRPVYLQAFICHEPALRNIPRYVHRRISGMEAPHGSSQHGSPSGHRVIKRVAIVGAESTGKTTLAQELAAHFHTVWVPEYGREYTEVNVGREAFFHYQWHDEEFLQIAQKQVELEDKLAEKANRVLICDTDALATCIWQERYLGSCSPEVANIAAHRRPLPAGWAQGRRTSAAMDDTALSRRIERTAVALVTAARQP